MLFGFGEKELLKKNRNSHKLLYNKLHQLQEQIITGVDDYPLVIPSVPEDMSS